MSLEATFSPLALDAIEERLRLAEEACKKPGCYNGHPCAVCAASIELRLNLGNVAIYRPLVVKVN